jgi:ADP-heptose:LPS heptosyltransferase
MEHILIIKHGALGDFIVATSAFAAIRAHHPGAHIVLLTTKGYASLGKQTDYFDDVWIDTRPKFWNFKALKKTLNLLRGGDLGHPFKRIYDLQSSDRTAWYFKLLGRNKPEWVGKAKGCSHPRNIPDNQMHVFDIFKTHLMRIGFEDVPYPNVDWLTDDISKLEPPPKFVLLVPGAAPTRPKKRWTAQGYADVIAHLQKQGLASVMLGAGAECEFAEQIAALCRVKPINLVGKTSLGALAALGRKACFALGSDTGPMHIIAAAGCPVLVLFSSDSNPTLHGPRSAKAEFIQVDDLKNLESQRVKAKLDLL